VEQYLEIVRTYDVLGAFWVNIRLAFLAGILALALGSVLALFRISPIPTLRWAGGAYVTVFRNMPLTIIMVFMTLGAWGQLNFVLSRDFDTNFFRLAVVGLAVYHAAFVCEAIRSGVNTVPIGQAEAARAIGLPFLASARLIILPQAFRGAIAPLGNVTIALIKNTTVAAAASVATETSSVMRTMIEFNSSYIYAIFLTFAIGYLILVTPVGLASTYFSQRLAVRR
jgi:glutamate transport system permease protein